MLEHGQQRGSTRRRKAATSGLRSRPPASNRLR